MLTRRDDAAYVAHVLSAWVARYLSKAPAASDTATAPGTVIVSETRQGKFSQIVQSGQHTLLADEPIDFGGDDTGLGPYDLLLAGLGACTSMTLRLYAEKKQLPLDRVTVTLAHSKIHATDCGDCETTSGKIDEIIRTIKLEGSLDQEQRQKLLEIANKCPVHRTLHSEVIVPTTLSDE